MDWSTARIISDSAQLIGQIEISDEVAIGPFTVIGFDPSPSRERFHRSEILPPVNQTVVIGKGVTIGANCIIERGAVIGDNCYIDHGSFIGSDTVLGEATFVRYRAQIHRRVNIGPESIVGGFVCNDTQIGRNCDFFGSCVHHYIGIPRGTVEPAPRIGNNAFVGFNAVVAGPVVVPDRAIIRAGAIVSPRTLNELAFQAEEDDTLVP